MSKSKPVMGSCEKCNTSESELFEYDGRFICKAAGCYDEEVEKNSGIHETRDEKLQDYKRLCQGTQGG